MLPSLLVRPARTLNEMLFEYLSDMFTWYSTENRSDTLKYIVTSSEVYRLVGV